MEIIISPGYGTGFSTEQEPDKRLLAATDPQLIAAVHTGNSEAFVCRANELDIYLPSSYNYETNTVESVKLAWFKALTIATVPPGSRFRVIQYDGAESLETDSAGFWWAVA